MRERLGSGELKLDVSAALKLQGATVQLGVSAVEAANVARTNGELRFTCGERQYCFHVWVTPKSVQVTDGVNYYAFQRLVEGAADTARDMPGELTSQMPGTVLKLLAKPGQRVAKGTPLLILEAMKMEHEVCAPADGVVEGYPHPEGARVMPGDLLVQFNPAADSPA